MPNLEPLSSCAPGASCRLLSWKVQVARSSSAASTSSISARSAGVVWLQSVRWSPCDCTAKTTSCGCPMNVCRCVYARLWIPLFSAECSRSSWRNQRGGSGLATSSAGDIGLGASLTPPPNPGTQVRSGPTLLETLERARHADPRRELVGVNRSSSLASLVSSTTSVIIHARRPATRRERSWFSHSFASRSDESRNWLRMPEMPEGRRDPQKLLFRGAPALPAPPPCAICCCCSERCSACARCSACCASRTARRARGS